MTAVRREHRALVLRPERQLAHAAPVAGSITLMSKPVFVLRHVGDLVDRARATRSAGRSTARTSAGALVRPSASITQICGEPVRFDVNAISVPSGDQAGDVSIAQWVVRRRTSRAVGVHHVDVLAPVPVRRERDARAVRRPRRQPVLAPARRSGESCRRASRRVTKMSW